jgi:hypothetical protein
MTLFINHWLIYSSTTAENASMNPTLSPATQAQFHDALDATLPFGPSYSGSTGLKLASHLPMVLGALYRLGAPEPALERHLAAWRPRLTPQAPAATLPDAPPAYGAPYADWLAHLANFAQADAGDDCPDRLLRTHLPALLAAPESGAFHGAIRLAYACDAGHRGEFIHALAAWCASFRSIGPMPATATPPAAGDANRPADPRASTAALRAALEAARADPSMAMAPRQNTTIFSDMMVAIDRPSFALHFERARPSLDALAEGALAVYLATRDFTALHLVTGTHAARSLLARVPLAPAAREEALARLWRAWLAAWVSIGAPAPDWAAVHAGSASEDDWEAARPALFETLNDHTIKLADSAREEWRHRGWPGYARCLPAARPVAQAAQAAPAAP